MLAVRLVGLAELGRPAHVAELEEALAADFYHVRVLDETHPQFGSLSAEDFPEHLVVGRFVRLLEDRIAEADTESEQRQLEQALQLGIALLQGRSVL
jgi:hypothetical protein